MRPGLRIAIVHDWLVRPGGAERVLEQLLNLFPKADLYVLFHLPGSVSPAIESRIKGTSFIQRLPEIDRHYYKYLPLFPTAVESLPLAGYDLVISSSYCVAKGSKAAMGSRHLCYCHTPMRYVWHQQDYYRLGLAPAFRPLFQAAAAYLRRWDQDTASRPDAILANSQNVAKRIDSYYRRKAEVVYPPVDTEFFVPKPRDGKGDFYLTVGALVPYKGFDQAVLACTIMGQRLLVAGDGPEMPKLRRTAGPKVEFLGWQPRENILRLLQGCSALISPGEEDFGIAAVEAQACGRPVVGLNRGGVRETVQNRVTGVLYGDEGIEALIKALRDARGLAFDPGRIRANALRFSVDIFRRSLVDSVERLMEGG